MFVQHHIKYEELHGVDEVVMMEQGEHLKLHYRLRREGKCAIPAEELRAISNAAHSRTDKRRKTQQKNNKLIYRKEHRFWFIETIGKCAQLAESILFNPSTGTVTYYSQFRGCGRRKLKFIDV